MKKKTYNIDIPVPCHENWNEMTPVEQGRFCNQCSKKVFDFTNMSDGQIIHVLEKNESICGRLQPEQLNRNLYQVPNYRPVFFPLPQLLFGFLAFASPAFVYSQNTTQMELIKGNVEVSPANRIIEGKLIDSTDMEPVLFSKVILQTADGKFIAGAQTEVDGYFKIIVPEVEDDFLYLTFPGYQIRPVIIDLKRDLPVNRNFYVETTDFPRMIVGIIVVTKKEMRKNKRANKRENQ